jgi:hypothetical protein
LREGHRLKDFKNGVPRGVFGLESDEVTGEWIATYSEELSDRYCSQNIIRVIKFRRMRWAGM